MASDEFKTIPSMDDFKDQIEKSLKKIKEGDIIKGTVIGISESEAVLDLGIYAEGIVKIEELSSDPTFSIKRDVALGEEMYCVVVSEDDGMGNILLSKKQADEILSWEKLAEIMETQTAVHVRIAQAVKGGVITWLYGIRGFIPASQLSIEYVEDLEAWVGKEIEAVVTAVSRKDRRLVLSGKEVELKKANQDRIRRMSKLVRGSVVTGTVEKIVPYGAFVNIGNGLTGLLHISQISEKRIKSPNEVLKEGETVTVQILDISDDKISLSMKAVAETSASEADDSEPAFTYQTGEEATTSLASLLKTLNWIKGPPYYTE